MKRFITALLSAALLLGLLAGCGALKENAPPAAPSQEESTVEESPEEAKALKIMILGSSRSVNTFHLLYEAFKDQMPEQELVLGVMYYSGCSMSMHMNFMKQDAAVYRYYCNSDGYWEITENVNMTTGLEAQNWDVILFQSGNGDLANNMNEPARTYMKAYVDERVKHPHVFWWHSTWFNSTDPELCVGAVTNLKPEDINQVAQLDAKNEATKEYILNDPMFAGHIDSGTPMMYALKVLEVPEKELYRDHTHLSDYGCLLVAYSWYAQFTNNPVTEIHLDKILARQRQSQYQRLGDMEITQQMKNVIIETVDYTMNHLWEIPVKE